jgi:predicted phage gp36 major capsid-like protein
MLTTEDIQNIIKAEKEVFATREEYKRDFEDLRKDFRALQTSVERLVTNFEKYYEEQKILTHKLERLEAWVKKAADKLGLNYEA